MVGGRSPGRLPVVVACLATILVVKEDVVEAGKEEVVEAGRRGSIRTRIKKPLNNTGKRFMTDFNGPNHRRDLFQCSDLFRNAVSVPFEGQENFTYISAFCSRHMYNRYDR